MNVQKKASGAAANASTSASASTNVSAQTSPQIGGSPPIAALSLQLPDQPLMNQYGVAVTSSHSEAIMDRAIGSVTGHTPIPEGFFAEFGDESWLDATLSGGHVSAPTPSTNGMLPAGHGHVGMMPSFMVYPPYMYGYPGVHPSPPGGHMPGWDPRWNGPQQ